jgi:hypothetical protein
MSEAQIAGSDRRRVRVWRSKGRGKRVELGVPVAAAAGALFFVWWSRRDFRSRRDDVAQGNAFAQVRTRTRLGAIRSGLERPSGLLDEESDVGPAQDCADDERDHRDGGQVEQPLADAGIEERRGIVGAGFVAMEKAVGNMRHSHDNLLARAAGLRWSGDRGTLRRMYSHDARMSRGVMLVRGANERRAVQDDIFDMGFT